MGGTDFRRGEPFVEEDIRQGHLAEEEASCRDNTLLVGRQHRAFAVQAGLVVVVAAAANKEVEQRHLRMPRPHREERATRQ